VEDIDAAMENALAKLMAIEQLIKWRVDLTTKHPERAEQIMMIEREAIEKLFVL